MIKQEKKDQVVTVLETSKKEPIEVVDINPFFRTSSSRNWSFEESSKFLTIAALEGKDLMYEFELSTGLRQGELFSLTWANINFDKKTVTIPSRKYTRYHTLALPSNLIDKLRYHKLMQKKKKEFLVDRYHQNLDLVFPSRNGRQQHPSVAQSQLDQLISKANVPRITFAKLRYTHGCLLDEINVHRKIIQARLGNKPTINYIYHIDHFPHLDEDQKAIEAFEKELFKHMNALNHF